MGYIVALSRQEQRAQGVVTHGQLYDTGARKMLEPDCYDGELATGLELAELPQSLNQPQPSIAVEPEPIEVMPLFVNSEP